MFLLCQKCVCHATIAVETRVFVNVSRINFRRGRIHTWQRKRRAPRYHKCADYSKISLFFFVVFLHSQRYFLHYSGGLVNRPARTLNEELARMQPGVLFIKWWRKVYHYIIASLFSKMPKIFRKSENLFCFSQLWILENLTNQGFRDSLSGRILVFQI